MPAALWALALSAFAIGTTEFVIVGLVPVIAADLAVSVPSAGLLVSLYALGVAVGAPLLTALTGRVPRKWLLVSLMAVFTVGNALAWLAPDYGTLVAARLLTGLTHGVFFAVASVIATSLVPRERAAAAISLVFSGLTIALVTGVPLGTFVGQHLGWRATFLVVAALGAVAFAGTALLLPRKLARPAPVGLLRQLAVLGQPRLLLVYAMTAAGYGGSFLAFTFLAPILQDLAGYSAGAVSLVLLGFGVSVALGNVWGGRLADRIGPIPALLRIFGGLAAVLAVLSVTASHPVLVVLTVLVWGAVAFANVPPLQAYVVRQAEKYAPHAADVASGLNIAAFNLGIAAGAWLGGGIVEHVGLRHTGWLGALVVLGAVGLTACSGWLERRGARRDRAELACQPQ
ncbi:MFS transporter [Verticiella sediminum]|uniref:MFS transporter n=1 Tax=Verticiella sediminum TaxID=1247510 RepID=A0A556APZ3_9BURK|nr:MFS transporter [Verticiella sediminum]TSH94968.1 MFS transporter [Verticiella sediminum]